MQSTFGRQIYKRFGTYLLGYWIRASSASSEEYSREKLLFLLQVGYSVNPFF